MKTIKIFLINSAHVNHQVHQVISIQMPCRYNNIFCKTKQLTNNNTEKSKQTMKRAK